jgi:hypothetical protein
MKGTKLILSIAFLVVSVCMRAKGMDPATLMFTDTGVYSQAVRGDADLGIPSNEIHIQHSFYDGLGYVYLVGGFTGTVRFGGTLITSNGLNDLYLCKFTTEGDLIWVTTQGGSNSDIAYDFAIAKNGSVYVVGSFSSATMLYGHSLKSRGESDALILKYDRNGKNLWVWDIAGGDSATVTCSIAIDETGAIYIGGTFTGTTYVAGDTMLTSKGYRDMFLVKLTNDDHFVRVVQYGGLNDDYLVRIASGTCVDKPNHSVPHSVLVIWAAYPGDPKHWFVWYSENGIQLTAPQSTTL